MGSGLIRTITYHAPASILEHHPLRRLWVVLVSSILASVMPDSGVAPP
jgi:hypothetical protein